MREDKSKKGDGYVTRDEFHSMCKEMVEELAEGTGEAINTVIGQQEQPKQKRSKADIKQIESLKKQIAALMKKCNNSNGVGGGSGDGGASGGNKCKWCQKTHKWPAEKCYHNPEWLKVKKAQRGSLSIIIPMK